jgi:ribulose-5-phosphate 4-epimerase/fuculose-1-phosphate aldolase
VDCVVHTHAAAANSFSPLTVPPRALSHGGVLFTEQEIPRFSRTGGLIKTAGLSADLARTLGDAPACLLPQHGLVAAGVEVAHTVMYAVLLTGVPGTADGEGSRRAAVILRRGRSRGETGRMLAG